MLGVKFEVQWRTTNDYGNEVWNTSGYRPADLEDARRHARVQTRTFSNVRIIRIVTEEVERVWPEARQ